MFYSIYVMRFFSIVEEFAPGCICKSVIRSNQGYEHRVHIFNNFISSLPSNVRHFPFPLGSIRLLAHAKVKSVKSKQAAERRRLQKKSWFSLGW